jgi:hypothetical protein
MNPLAVPKTLTTDTRRCREIRSQVQIRVRTKGCSFSPKTKAANGAKINYDCRPLAVG